MQDNSPAKYAFYYMLSLVALIFMTLSTGMIIFQIINQKLTDVLNPYSGVFSPQILKFAISAIIISAPIYFFTTFNIHKNLFSGQLLKDSGIRKWLTYLILFISSVVMIGWLIATINNFLNGELTAKFILKSLTAILIAASVFSYYFYEIKREEVLNKKDIVVKSFFIGALALVIITFAASLFFVESPTETRNRNQDNAVIMKFNTFDSGINTFYTEKKKLPSTLDELIKDYSYIQPSDLENSITKEKFEYKMIDKNTYELCATFLTGNKFVENDYRYNVYSDKRWLHDAGKQCLKQKVISFAEAKTLDSNAAQTTVPQVKN